MRTAVARTTRPAVSAKPMTGTMDVATAIAVWTLLSILGWGIVAAMVKIL